MKKLEIYGTLGPSCCHKEIIRKMFELGMNGMRLNLSHCNLWDKKEWIDAFHQAKDELGIQADLLIDMRGPELRVSHIDEDINVEEGKEIELSIPVIPNRVLESIEINDKVLLDDGKIKLLVKEISARSFKAEVLRGGKLKNNKSIAITGKSIEGDVLTPSDILNLKEAKKYGVTGIMQPFVNSAKALMEVKNTLKTLNADDLKVYAKIENSHGFHHLTELFDYCDCIVIARGDLGNAYGLPVLPAMQHRIEHTCHQYHFPYMVVTEMLYSMQEKAVPTRAEVSDIFHAVYQGASSIMLTGETASGKYPVEAMKYFTQTASLALKEREIDFVIND
ncbi:MAG: pyruvate kinase [Bacilli bacterium]|nr:pyruvate kinase [Bacilli bacterium]